MSGWFILGVYKVFWYSESFLSLTILGSGRGLILILSVWRLIMLGFSTKRLAKLVICGLFAFFCFMLEWFICIVLPKSNIAIVGFCSCDLFALRFNLELAINLPVHEESVMDRVSLIGLFGECSYFNAPPPKIVLSARVTLFSLSDSSSLKISTIDPVV